MSVRVLIDGDARVSIVPYEPVAPRNFEEEFTNWRLRHSWYKHIKFGENFSIFPVLNGQTPEWLITEASWLVNRIADPEVRALVLSNQVRTDALIYGGDHGFHLTIEDRETFKTSIKWITYAQSRYPELAQEVERQEAAGGVNTSHGPVPELVKAAKCAERDRVYTILRTAAAAIWAGLVQLGYTEAQSMAQWSANSDREMSNAWNTFRTRNLISKKQREREVAEDLKMQVDNIRKRIWRRAKAGEYTVRDDENAEFISMAAAVTAEIAERQRICEKARVREARRAEIMRILADAAVDHDRQEGSVFRFCPPPRIHTMDGLRPEARKILSRVAKSPGAQVRQLMALNQFADISMEYHHPESDLSAAIPKFER